MSALVFVLPAIYSTALPPLPVDQGRLPSAPPLPIAPQTAVSTVSCPYLCGSGYGICPPILCSLPKFRMVIFLSQMGYLEPHHCKSLLIMFFSAGLPQSATSPQTISPVARRT